MLHFVRAIREKEKTHTSGPVGLERFSLMRKYKQEMQSECQFGFKSTTQAFAGST